MINRIFILFCFISGFQNVLISGEYHNFKPGDIPLILDILLSNVSKDNDALLQSTHPVMVLAVSKSNGTISNVIEEYLHVFDPVLGSDEACSISLRDEANNYLRKVSDGAFYCLDQLNSQLLATSRAIQEFVPLKDCLNNLEKESIAHLKTHARWVRLCSYFLTIPLDSVNLDPSGISKALRRARLSQN